MLSSTGVNDNASVPAGKLFGHDDTTKPTKFGPVQPKSTQDGGCPIAQNETPSPKSFIRRFGSIRIVPEFYSYSEGVPSFYDEPRSKLLKFVRWVCGTDDYGDRGGGEGVSGEAGGGTNKPNGSRPSVPL